MHDLEVQLDSKTIGFLLTNKSNLIEHVKSCYYMVAFNYPIPFIQAPQTNIQIQNNEASHLVHTKQ